MYLGQTSSLLWESESLRQLFTFDQKIFYYKDHCSLILTDGKLRTAISGLQEPIRFKHVTCCISTSKFSDLCPPCCLAWTRDILATGDRFGHTYPSPPGDVGNIWRNFYFGNVLLVSSGSSPGMMLNAHRTAPNSKDLSVPECQQC